MTWSTQATEGVDACAAFTTPEDSGAVHIQVGRWQLGAIFSLSSGTPLTIGAGSNPYGIAGNFPDMVTALPKSFGKVTKTNLPPGVITYFNGIQQVPDPGRSGVTTCSLS